MMTQALLFGICGALLCVILRQSGRAEFAFVIGIVTTVGIVFLCAGEVSSIIESAKLLSLSSGLSYDYFKPIIKITGIAYIAQMGAELCRDAKEGAIATKIELAGKVLIAAMAIPIMSSMFELIVGIVE